MLSSLTYITNHLSLKDILITNLNTLPKKKGLLGTVDRVFLISHTNFHQKNLEQMVKILLDNDYPLNFIFDIIRKNIKVLINKKILNQTVNNNNDSSNKDKKKKTNWFTIPYV